MSGKELLDSKVWWNGPEFLCLPRSEWPSVPPLDDCEEAQSELIKSAPVISHTFARSVTPCKLQEVIDCKHFSTLDKLLKVTAYVIRFKKKLNCLNTSSPTQGVANSCLLTAEEIKESEMYWIKAIQQESFSAEIKHLISNSTVGGPVRINQFGLFLDEGILKYRGRLNNSTLDLSSKNPVLLPHDHRFVELLVLDYHKRSKHSGVNDTLTLLIETYWILKGKRTVKCVIKKYVTCLK